MRIGIVGTGAVAQTFAHLLAAHGLLAGVYGRNRERALTLVQLHPGTTCLSLQDLWSCDAVGLAVSDGAIAQIARLIADAAPVQRTLGIAWHFSGALGAGELSALKALGVSCGSLHPATSFAQPMRVAEHFEQTICALEGDDEACDALSELIERLGGRPLRLAAGRKLVYHAGAVFAANYVVAVLGAAAQCFREAGVAPSDARRLLQSLGDSALAAVAAVGPANALTGPVARGDWPLVNAEQQALKAIDRPLAEAYGTLAALAARLSLIAPPPDATDD